MKREAIKYSLNNLKQRKTRSLFTIISILVGITTIFIFISFGLGLYSYVEEISSGSSANKIIIQPKGIGVTGMDTTFKLTDDDLEAIEKTSGVYEASGVYLKTAEVKQGKEIFYTMLIGYDPKKPLIMDTYNFGIEQGRELSSGDNSVNLGYNYQIADKIFSKQYSLGENIKIQGKKIKIIGFYEKLGSAPDDAQIYITNDFIKKLYPNETLSYSWIVAEVDTSDIEKVVENVEKNLRKERGLEKGKEDFFVQSFDSMMETYMNILNMIIGFVILIALISVLVSGINTASTMITSVLERKKEIGIMKSIGSKNSNILSIFLFESSFLGFIAGCLGVFFGWLISLIGGIILDNLGYGFLSPSFSVWLFIGCIGFATLTGAISGVAPAINASRINPVEALRYE